MAHHMEITVEVRFTWWWRWYIEGVNLTSWLTGLEPDLNKVYAVLKHAVRTKVTAS